MGFLDQVVADKQREVAEKSALRPLARLQAEAEAVPVRDFHAAVARPGAIIAELKARTPTVTAFTHSRSLAALAETYARAGAAAISIVTDAERFGTSLADVSATRERVPLPVIAKDFVIDPYQILEARTAGADAILLIARILAPASLRAFLTLTHDLGMSALVETHSEREIEHAVAAGARIIGINNRDLDTMEISLDTTRKLARFVPAGVVLVTESGIRTPGEIAELAACGAGAFLVGGSLLAADDPAAALRALASAATKAASRAATRERHP